jgi:hypothetical protein
MIKVENNNFPSIFGKHRQLWIKQIKCMSMANKACMDPFCPVHDLGKFTHFAYDPKWGNSIEKLPSISTDENVNCRLI